MSNAVFAYRKEIGDRLAAAKAEGMFEGTLKVRNQEGLMQTFSRLLEMAEQSVYNDPKKSYDPAIALATFSKTQADGMLGAYDASGSNVGVSGAANLRTMDAMDISIAAAAFSLIPYLAIERAMSSSSTNISYQDIVAEYANGDVAEGETVLGAFEVPNPKLNLALPTKTQKVKNDGDAPADLEVQFGVALMPETLGAQVVSDSTVVAQGMDHNGQVWFSGSAALNATVDYKHGIVKFSAVPAGYEIDLSVNIDSTSDTTGQTIPTVTADYKNVILTATPKQMIYKDNNLKNAYLNKLNIQVAGTGLTMDYGQMAVGKLITIYIEYINRLVVGEVMRAGNSTVITENAKGMAQVTVDISDYLGSSAQGGFADTKFDYLKGFVINLNQRSISVSGKGLTALLVGNRGLTQLSNTPYFVKSAQYDTLNAMVGTFDGIPVIRHQIVDLVEPSDGKSAYVYGIYKDPAGNAAPVAFGEFLPVRLTDPVSNYNNPEQVARSLSSYAGVVTCVPQLAHLGIIKIMK